MERFGLPMAPKAPEPKPDVVPAMKSEIPSYAHARAARSEEMEKPDFGTETLKPFKPAFADGNTPEEQNITEV